MIIKTERQTDKSERTQSHHHNTYTHTQQLLLGVEALGKKPGRRSYTNTMSRRTNSLLVAPSMDDTESEVPRAKTKLSVQLLLKVMFSSWAAPFSKSQLPVTSGAVSFMVGMLMGPAVLDSLLVWRQTRMNVS